jgi:hypothetical protein
MTSLPISRPQPVKALSAFIFPAALRPYLADGFVDVALQLL